MRFARRNALTIEAEQFTLPPYGIFPFLFHWGVSFRYSNDPYKITFYENRELQLSPNDWLVIEFNSFVRKISILSDEEFQAEFVAVDE